MTARDVKHLSGDFFRRRFGGQQVGPHDVADIGEIPRLQSIAVNDGRLAREQAGAELGNDAGVRRVKRLARTEDALRELKMAVTLRANEALILYNAACLYCTLNRKAEGLDALHKAWEVGYRDAVWARRDPDLLTLHDDPEFNRMFPEPAA